MSKRNWTTDEFIAKARTVHGSEKYDYSLVDYKNSVATVEILCKIHGKFSQVAREHIRGKGCAVCGGTALSNTDSFIAHSIRVHGTSYNYDAVKYKKDSEKVTILCNTCDTVFLQSPNNHKMGHGCPHCGILQQGRQQCSTTEAFKEKIFRLFGNKFDLSKIQYINSRQKVIIGCTDHGEFLMSPTSLLSGQGCPACASYGFNDSKQGVLYVLSTENMTKVGISNIDVFKRARQISKSSGRNFTVVYVCNSIKIGSVRSAETEVLSYLKKLYLQPLSKFNGYTECFYDVNLSDLLNKINQLTTEQGL